MKRTIIVQRLDRLERIVIPIELRNKFKINKNDMIEILSKWFLYFSKKV